MKKVFTFPVQIFLENEQETWFCKKPTAFRTPTAPKKLHSPLGSAPFQYLSLQSLQTNFNRIGREKCFPGAGHKSFRSRSCFETCCLSSHESASTNTAEGKLPHEIFLHFFSPFDRNNLPTYYRDLKRKSATLSVCAYLMQSSIALPLLLIHIFHGKNGTAHSVLKKPYSFYASAR